MRFVSAAVLSMALAALPAASFALTHSTEYRTNIGNYRTCVGGLDDSCTYADVVSPSNYYLANNHKITVLHQSNGNVQLRIDAGTIKGDTDFSFPCDNEYHSCSVGSPGNCSGPKGPTQGCNRDTCLGGSNEGAQCNTASQCPGGACTAGAACTVTRCTGGPRDGELCGGSAPSCTSSNGSTGWELRFLGNRSSGVFVPAYLLNYYELKGNGACEKRCPFTLESDGSYNDDVICTIVGSCSGGPEVFHHVILLDRQDLDDGVGPKQILGVPSVGPASILEGSGGVGSWIDPGDPAKYGD